MANLPVRFVCKGCGQSSVLNQDAVHSVFRSGKWRKGKACSAGYWRMVDIDHAFEAVFTMLAARHSTLMAMADSIKIVLDAARKEPADGQ